MSAAVSACIIACDEEDLLPRCLDSVAWADERVIVVDEKSIDATEKIARERADRVEVRAFVGDLDQKRFATGLARNDWVIVIDPDEELSPAAISSVRRIMDEAPVELAGIELDRVTWHLGRWIRHGDFHPDWKLRVFRRSRARWVGRDPHGRTEVDGRVVRAEGDLYHRSYRDLADQIDRIQAFSERSAAALHAEGRRVSWHDLCLRPLARFLRAYLLKRGFLDGMPGFVIASATAFHVHLKYAKLWEMQRASGSPPAGRSVPPR